MSSSIFKKNLIEKSWKEFFKRPQKHFAPIDAVRVFTTISVLAASVVLSVTWFYPPEGARAKEWVESTLFTFLSGGGHQIDIFFMISSFLMSYKLIDELNRGKFVDVGEIILDRMLRLWPLMLVATFLTAIVWGSNAAFSGIQKPFFFFNNLVTWSDTPFNLLSSWTSSVDIQLTAIFSIVIFGIHRLYKINFLVASLLLFLSIATFMLNISFNYEDSLKMKSLMEPSIWKVMPKAAIDSVQHRFADVLPKLFNDDRRFLGIISEGSHLFFSPLAHLGSFATGTCLAVALLHVGSKTTPSTSSQSPLKWILLAASIISLVYTPQNTQDVSDTIFLFHIVFLRILKSIAVAFILFCSMCPETHSLHISFLKDFLSLKLWYPLAQITYGIFLFYPIIIHDIVLKVINPDNLNVVSIFLSIAIILAVSGVLATLAHVLIERPSFQLRKWIMALLSTTPKKPRKPPVLKPKKK